MTFCEVCELQPGAVAFLQGVIPPSTGFATYFNPSAARHMKSHEHLLPPTAVSRLVTPLRRFIHIQASSGIVLLVCALIALGLANSPWSHDFFLCWETEVVLSVGHFTLAGSLGHLVINDGLMTLFFFVVGLEIKRELVSGELADIRNALLPVIAAVGGMIVPALVYLAFQWDQPGQVGWAIPMATDIAFVVGLLAMFGPKVPLGLKVFLLSLAIVDDLGAILIIAFVFSESISWAWLIAAGLGLTATALLNRIGVRLVGVYAIVGFFVWLAFYKSGVHPTVAGVLLGLMTPATAWVGENVFARIVQDTWQGGSEDEAASPRPNSLTDLRFALRETQSPLHRLEKTLHPWVAFVIMPIFALANAGVPLEVTAITQPVAIAVLAGLTIGKPVGILLACILAVSFKITSLPKGVSWLMLAGGACFAGIGFTMALFLNSLSFPTAEHAVNEAAGKIGTLLGSFVSAVLGSALLLIALRTRQAASLPNTRSDAVR